MLRHPAWTLGERRGKGVPERTGPSGGAGAAAHDHQADDLIELYEAVAELPKLDLRLQLSLPRLLSPALERLRSAIADEDPDEFEESLPAALAEVDNPHARARLARSVIALRDEGRIPRDVAAAALLDLDSEGEAMVREALVAALGVDCGAARTPSGLLLVG